MGSPLEHFSVETLTEVANSVALNNRRRCGIGRTSEHNECVSVAWLTMFEVDAADRYNASVGRALGFLACAASYAVKRFLVKDLAMVRVGEGTACDLSIMTQRIGHDTILLNFPSTEPSPEHAVWEAQVRDALTAEFADMPKTPVRAGVDVLMGTPPTEAAKTHNVSTYVVYKITARMRLRIKRSKQLAALAADIIPNLS